MKCFARPGRPNLAKVVLLAATFAAAAALPAGATTPTSFTLTAGALSISAPTVGVSLQTAPVSNSAIPISGPLGVVTVSDQRGRPTTWTASVISTAFTGAPVASVIPATAISYIAGTITPSGLVTGTAVAGTTTNLTGSTAVVTGVSTGISSASWDPVISMTVPANFPPGIYSAAITHSIA